MKRIFSTALLAALSLSSAEASGPFLTNYYARAAYNIGGTAPIGMPASIRKMNSYSLRPNFTLEIGRAHV